MKDNDLKTWRRLYEAAELLKTQKPWELEDDHGYDFIEIEQKDGELSAYCTLVGWLEKSHTISIYESNDALFDIIYLMEHEGIPWHQGPRYNNCLNVIFGDRDLLLPADRKMIELLGLKFRGRRAWPMFRSYEKGRYDRRLNVREAARLAEVIEHLAQVYADIRSDNLDIIDANENMLRRSFNSTSKRWATQVAALNYEPRNIMSFSVTDEILMKQLKKMKKLKTVIEIDVMYHIISTERDANGRSILDRFAMCCEADKPSDPYLMEALEPEDEEIPTILNILTGYIEKFGRPSKIKLRDSMIEASIKEICDELGIRTSVYASLTAIDEVFLSVTGLDKLDISDEE